MMMMSYLCQRSTVSPVTQLPPAEVDIKPIQTFNGHENKFSEHCTSCRSELTCPVPSNSTCDPSFISDCSCVLRRVSKCLISGTASGFVRSNSGLSSTSVNIERFATSGIQSESVCDVSEIESEVTSITVDELARSLNKCKLGSSTPEVEVAAVVDCRGFVSFNANHVKTAFNASCGDRFARKRLLDGKITVADLVSGGPETSESTPRDQYRRLLNMAVADGSAIVAYDDDTRDVEALPATHPLRIITEYLKKTGAAIKYLTGGLQAFHSAYPMMCSKPYDPPSRPLLYSPTTPLVEMDVDSAAMSEILPHLFIGNERDAASRTILQTNSINCVLNVTSHVPLHFEHDDNMVCKRLPATDNGCQNLKQYFEEAITFIESARCSGGRVLVHCQAGVSRSPTIVLAYLMARYNLTMMTAFCYAKSLRHIIAPNFNFMGQLLEFEQRCSSGELRHCLRDDIPPVPISFAVPESCENLS